MIRFILLAIAGLLIYSLWKWTMGRYNRTKDRLEGLTKGSAKGVLDGNMSELVQDPVCKLYIAKDKAIFYNGNYFCSEKCRGSFENK